MTTRDARKNAIAFLNMPWHIQMEIVRGLGILREGAVGNTQDFIDAFRKAKDTGKLSDLHDAIEREVRRGGPDS